MAKITRLTAERRSAIVKQAMDKHFTPRREALLAARTAFANDLYNLVAGKDLEAIGTLPDYWFNWSDKIVITAEGFTSRYRPGLDWEFPLARTVAVPNVVGDLFTVEPGHPLWADMDGIRVAHYALEAAEEEMKAMLFGIVNSAFSVEKLVEIWPEGREFFSLLQPKPAQTALVDAALVQTVNKLLGLK